MDMQIDLFISEFYGASGTTQEDGTTYWTQEDGVTPVTQEDGNP